MTMPNEPTPGMGPHPVDGGTDHLLPASQIRPVKALGMAGFVLLLVALAFIGVALVAAPAGWALIGWVSGAIAASVLTLVCFIASRVVLTRTPGHERAEHDPLIPEVTAEEAAQYKADHPSVGQGTPMQPDQSTP